MVLERFDKGGELRPAGPQDIITITEMYCSMMMEKKPSCRPQFTKVMDWLLGLSRDPRFTAVILNRDGEDVGMMIHEMMAPFGSTEELTLHIHELYVKPEHRGLGSAAPLIQHAIEYARHCNAKITCITKPSGVKLYERLGLKPSGVVYTLEADNE